MTSSTKQDSCPHALGCTLLCGRKRAHPLDLIAAITDEEKKRIQEVSDQIRQMPDWKSDCMVCEMPGRPYASGFWCKDHVPGRYVLCP